MPSLKSPLITVATGLLILLLSIYIDDLYHWLTGDYVETIEKTISYKLLLQICIGMLSATLVLLSFLISLFMEKKRIDNNKVKLPTIETLNALRNQLFEGASTLAATLDEKDISGKVVLHKPRFDELVMLLHSYIIQANFWSQIAFPKKFKTDDPFDNLVKAAINQSYVDFQHSKQYLNSIDPLTIDKHSRAYRDLQYMLKNLAPSVKNVEAILFEQVGAQKQKKK